jgi:hypothetical protein
MSLSLKESRAIGGMAGVLYTFLPNSGHSDWTNHVTFRTIAEKAGVPEFWQSGSKRPALTVLLERTLDHKRSQFEKLIIEIVRAGILYRDKNNNPVTVEEIDNLNGYLLEVSFKFPELWDAAFRASLKCSITNEPITAQQSAVALQKRSDELAKLKDEFFALYAEPDRRAAGFALEKILNRLFAACGLTPRQSFRVEGEQIDGSFELDHEIYLVEAKWEKDRLPENPLLVFRGKIEGKSAYTRGVFIALNGITGSAKKAITTGKQPTFFLVDGFDLNKILSEEVSLDEFLRQKYRILAEEGLVAVPYTELWSGSRGRNSR